MTVTHINFVDESEFAPVCFTVFVGATSALLGNNVIDFLHSQLPSHYSSHDCYGVDCPKRLVTYKYIFLDITNPNWVNSIKKCTANYLTILVLEKTSLAEASVYVNNLEETLDLYGHNLQKQSVGYSFSQLANVLPQKDYISLLNSLFECNTNNFIICASNDFKSIYFSSDTASREEENLTSSPSTLANTWARHCVWLAVPLNLADLLQVVLAKIKRMVI